MRRSALVLLIGVLLWCTAGQECKFTDPETGLNYNLLPLRQPTNSSENEFYSIQNTLGEFNLNVCGAVNPSLGCPSNTAVCQKDTERNMYSDGSASGFTLSAFTDQTSSGVELVYVDGDECIGNGTRTTHLKIVCVPGAVPVVTKAEQDVESDCIYNIWMNSEYGCPSNETQPSQSSSPTLSPSVSMSPSVAPSPSRSASMSSSASAATPSASLSVGGSPSPSTSTSASASISPSASASTSWTNSMSESTTSSAYSSASVSSSLAGEEPPSTPEEPGTWAWYVMIGVVVLVLCLTALIAVAVILQKKRQNEVEFDPFDFE